MSDADLIAEDQNLAREWREMRQSLDECGGASGSPGEWLWERMGELEAELKRRGLPVSPAEGGGDVG
ncbi:hypothetical protein [Methylobacterium sp. Gmos1]